MATKKRARKKKAAGPRGGEYTAQLVVRLKPATRKKLDTYARKNGWGVGEALRQVLEGVQW